MMGSENIYRTYDLMQIFVEYNQLAKTSIKVLPIAAAEIALLWHAPARDVLTQFGKSWSNPEKSHEDRLTIKVVSQVYESHTFMKLSEFLEKSDQLLEATADPHYTFAELARDFLAQESILRDIDTAKQLESIIQSSPEFKE
jgi:hypothetical protein